MSSLTTNLRAYVKGNLPECVYAGLAEMGKPIKIRF